ncbi:hypothetical protein [Rhodoplanes sp. SY1]|uniref:hypothetical protein n=1 Tax=Rhodoplanes sp. SY1 TaxID=3166646 RepID=UPI0038B4E8AB
MIAVIALVAWNSIGLPLFYSNSPVTHESLPGCVSVIIGICFVKTSGDAAIFGFAEFVQAFALLILVYTISDSRYRFRIESAPLPIFKMTFWTSIVIGAGTLVSDLWFGQNYPAPWFLASQVYWNFAFGCLFMIMVFTWIWFAFFQPPTFGSRNATRFLRTLYTSILQGSEHELPMFAAELGRSARSIIENATEMSNEMDGGYEEVSPTEISDSANNILLLIGNKKFCRHVVASSPATAIELFHSMSEIKKYQLPIGQFASNLTTEALLNKDSILFHEDDGYCAGYLGYTRPFTNTIFGDFILVETLASSRKLPLRY